MAKPYRPKTGQPCNCSPGIYRDNCANCEGTGMAIDFATIHARKSYQPIVGQLFSAHIVSALIDVLARLIKENQLREKHGEDTIGVLMKCGAFHAVAGTSFDDDKFVAELAKQIDQVQLGD